MIWSIGLLTIAKKGEHLVIETKAGKDLSTARVQEKRQAALTWVNAVTGDTGAKWSYLLIAERDLYDAKGSLNRIINATTV